MTQKNVEVLVCTKCRRGLPVEEGCATPGQQLFNNLTAQGLPDGVTLKSVECLSNCSPWLHGLALRLSQFVRHLLAPAG